MKGKVPLNVTCIGKCVSVGAVVGVPVVGSTLPVSAVMVILVNVVIVIVIALLACFIGMGGLVSNTFVVMVLRIGIGNSVGVIADPAMVFIVGVATIPVGIGVDDMAISN